jgi:hypothetical protein
VRIPPEALRSVVFLGRRDSPGSDDIHLVGTGFFVGIPEGAPKMGGWVYLVTAKHIAIGLGGVPFVIRANTVDGGGALVEWAATDWTYHPADAGVDIAVIPWAPADPIEAEYVATTLFAEVGAIAVGEEAFATGLFAFASGRARNQPIVRTGHVAMIPDEPVQTAIGRIEALLVELHAIGGLSGAPVFGASDGRTTLLGLVHGHWDAVTGTSGQSLNTGVAIVIPAWKILEVLEQETLAQSRAANPPS